MSPRVRFEPNSGQSGAAQHRRVRLEPIGVEIDCASDETILDAAFRQGYNLVYGCREGQCSACKCFLLEGDVALKPYSTFALSDSEQANGYSLMCRSMPERDLVVELLHYDPDAYRLEHAIADGSAVVSEIESLTHDIVRLVLTCDQEFAFTPGQYVDLHVGDGRRSFSMANLPGDGLIELIVKRYTGGRFSGLLDGGIGVGDRLSFTGPYGSLRVRESERPILMVAGGSGMAPILSVLRQLCAQRCSRPVRFFYGARARRDLFYLDEIEQLGARLPDFRFTPIVDNFVHNAVDAYLAEGEIAQPDVYMCGPPPMIEAAEEMLVGTHGIDEQRIFSDKFTTAAEAAAPAPPAAVALASERDFAWYLPAGRHATLYEDVTIDTQPSVHRHLRRGWPVSFEDGRGTWDDGSTALRAEDWFAFRDPGGQWERPFYQGEAAIEQQIEGAIRSATAAGLIDDFQPGWVEFLEQVLQVPAFVEHGLWFALATVARDCLSDSVATCVCLQAAMKQRSAQAIVLYAMDLEQQLGRDFAIATARRVFLSDPVWQPVRRYLERLAATKDWAEVVIAANVCFEPIVGTLLRRELGIRAAAANGDTVTPVLARADMQEWEWARAWTIALVRFACADQVHGGANRDVITGWVRDWRAEASAAALALAPLAQQIPAGIDVEQALDRIEQYADALLVEAGLSDGPGAAPALRRRTRVPQQRRHPTPAAARTTAATSPPVSPVSPDSYDYVGIVMARSAEGDAVAEILGRREDIEVIEQPAFWDIRAKVRLAIPYAEVSDQLGYEIDAYSIQHEMSTHYGRMVATDDALMLFSDPAEAMQYLMS